MRQKLGTSLFTFCTIVSAINAPAAVEPQRAEELVHKALAEFAADIEASHHRPVTIKFFWDSPSFNAYGGRDGDVVAFGFYGGILAGEADEDSFLALFCHELGHVLGGLPTLERLPFTSVEGQADYFATAKCLRRLFSEDDNGAFIQNYATDQPISQSCHQAFSTDPAATALCIRSLVSVRKTFQLLYKDAGLGFAVEDSTVAPATVLSYPSAQCRLDTAKAGALCDKPAEEGFSFSDLTTGACAEPSLGARPKCWFRPAQASH